MKSIKKIKEIVAYLFILLGFMWGILGLLIALKYYDFYSMLEHAIFFFATILGTLFNVVIALVMTRNE